MGQQPTPPQQPPVPPLAPPQPTPPIADDSTATSAANPGQATGIISLILAFVGLAPFGLVLSIISTVQSKKAKASAVLGIIGIVINAIAVLTFVFLILVFSVAYQGIQQRAKESQSQTSANTVETHAETYYTTYGTYPQSIADFEKDPTTSLKSTHIDVVARATNNAATITYKPCGPTGAEVTYFSTTQNIPVPAYLGDASAASCSDQKQINTAA